MHEIPLREMESRWQEWWGKARVFEPGRERSASPLLRQHRDAAAILGLIHMGHVRNYSIGDALAWFRKDARASTFCIPWAGTAFGLPAENAAIANRRRSARVDPREHRRDERRRSRASPSATIGTARSRPASPNTTAGISGSFSRCWSAASRYAEARLVNWCPKCATVLANEQVVDGLLLAA